ncbi:YidH family protein [Pseudaestuariivita atlantica]|uniref:DNA polymerase III subunit gamma/tau n=1 Tax=Pseudaestuariivita atlantica TaxID=1317121 RepID=A0A0L1JRD4_9RHOB|nr:DUF202 domain-containing protein [Pseudaestuariivita atlantica]KNG94277.1 DNA polymerase III subunit gamma/tau [Pseudaestuariivita atlantica]
MADPDKDSSQDMAAERTDWAEDRTVLANERTFAGWMRTGAAFTGIAIGLKAVFGEADPTWIAKAAATAFLLIAIGVFWTAYRAACATQRRLDAQSAEPQSRRAYLVIASTLSLATLAIGVILWSL